MNTITKGWKRKKNHDLWEQLDELIARHQITWEYVRGHAGHDYNERCDKLAVAQIDNCR
jgi:ribonuclease HI